MSKNQKTVVEQLTETIRLFDAAAETLPPRSAVTQDVYEQHASIRKQLQELRDSYGKPAELRGSVVKHPLVQLIENAIPKREARFDVMRAYDEGMRDTLKIVEQYVNVLNRMEKYMEEKEPTTPEEIAAHNLEMIKKMRDEGVPAHIIHATFQNDGIDLPLEFFEEICKPGVMEAISANSAKRLN